MGIFLKPIFGTHHVLTNVSSRPLFALDSGWESSTVTLSSIRDSGLPRFQHSFRQRAALRRGLESRLASPVVFQQPVADLVEIVGQDPEPDVPLKA